MQGHQHQQTFVIVAQTYELCIQTFTSSNVRWKLDDNEMSHSDLH